MKNLVFLTFFNVTLAVSQQPNQLDSLLLQLPSLSDSAKVEVYGKLFHRHRNKKPDLARLYLDTMRLWAKPLNSEYFDALLANNEGVYAALISELLHSEDSLRKSVYLFEKIGDQRQLAKSLMNLGITQRTLGKLDSSMYQYMKSLRIKESIDTKPIEIGNLYSSIGTIHGTLANFEKANEYFLKAEAQYLIIENESKLASVWNKMALNHKINGTNETALVYFKKALEVYASKNYMVGLSRINNNMGWLYLEADSLDLAEKHLIKALEFNTARKNSPKRTFALSNLAEVYIRTENYSKALVFAKQSYEIAKKAKHYQGLITSFKALSQSYAGLGEYQRAYEYEKLHFTVYDSVFQERNLKKINELEVKYETEKKDAELALQEEELKTLNEKAKVDKLTKGLYAGGMFSFVAISGLMFFGFRQRLKRNRIAREKQEEIYRQEIEHKKKELASQTLHLVQKNTFLQELKENLEKIKKSPELFKIEFRRLTMLLKKQSAEDKDWEVFKSYFADVHDNFDNKLKALHKDITDKEIRLAAFLRMNLTTKEIAAMLNVIPTSILTSKYRLKKKLGLDKETDLSSFLHTL